MSDVTAELVRDLLDYNPDTGVFIKKNGGGPKKRGEVIGSRNKYTGYWSTTIHGNNYYLHRLAWLHVHGRWPELEIDHKNRDKSDNRLQNLREATPSQNKTNRISLVNTSGFKGVRRHGRNWQAMFCGIPLGTYASPAEAHAVYADTARALRGEFARV